MTDSRDNVLAAVARGVRVGTLDTDGRLETTVWCAAAAQSAPRIGEGMIGSSRASWRS